MTLMAIHTEFQGKPLVPKNVPHVDFLREKHGKAVLDEYNGIVRSSFGCNRALTVLSYDESADVVRGSNPYAVALVDKILRQHGLRVVTQADLERILKFETLDLRGHYEDSGLVLRSKDGANSYLARDLIKQVKARQKLRFPAMIPLTEVDVVPDQNSDSGLAFKLKDGAQIYHTPILRKDGRFNSEDIDESTGLPKKTGKEGSRYLYTRPDGLSRLYLNWGLDLGSYVDDLSYSGSGGRVVVVSEGAKKL